MGHMKVWRKGRGMHKLLQIYLIKRVKKFVWYMGHAVWVVRIFFFPGLNGKKKIGVTHGPCNVGPYFPGLNG